MGCQSGNGTSNPSSVHSGLPAGRDTDDFLLLNILNVNLPHYQDYYDEIYFSIYNVIPMSFFLLLNFFSLLKILPLV